MSLLKLSDLNRLFALQPEHLLGGYFRLPWNPIYQETQISPENFVLTDQYGNKVATQVFKTDLQDSPHDFLLISLNDNQSITSLNIKKDEPIKQNDEFKFPRLEILLGPDCQTRGVKLLNGQLSVWFNLIPSPQDYTNDWNWYSGSATSILLGEQEMLEPFKWHDTGSITEPHWMGHDPQQRCMQIDKIQVWDQSSNNWSKSYNPFYESYELIKYSIGSLGVSITIASAPFSYGNEDKKCRLYRIISLFKGVDYVQEEIFVKEKDNELEFKAHYFSFMNLSKPISVKDKSHEVFLMVSNLYSWSDANILLFPTYGFRSNVFLEHIENEPKEIVEYPTDDFPNWPNKYRSFSWGLSRCQLAKCQHRFTFLGKDACISLTSKLNDCDLILPKTVQEPNIVSALK